MAILKHKTSKNKRFQSIIDYLTTEEDGYGNQTERKHYLIDGIHCTPDNFPELCIRDRLQYRVQSFRQEVISHQYIISFHPEDIHKGLTLEEAQCFGMLAANTYFPGHRAIVCSHPDGTSHSGNIHIHIVISSLRFVDRPPEKAYMRLRNDGSVKPSEYKAGCRHQNTAKLRIHMNDYIQTYYRAHGYAVIEKSTSQKTTDKEYRAARQATQPTRKDELRWVISDAAEKATSWENFRERLQTDYTRQVTQIPGFPPIPYPQRKEMWTQYKQSKQVFWGKYHPLSQSYRQQLTELFEKLHLLQKNKIPHRSHPVKAQYQAEIVKELKSRIAVLKEKQQALNRIRKTYQFYSKAAALALMNHMQEDTFLCLEQMEQLSHRMLGNREKDLNTGGGSFSLVGGKAQFCAHWLDTGKEEAAQAEAILQQIEAQVKSLCTDSQQPQLHEEPFSVKVKITRGSISFQHPDMECWIRGKRLGKEYTLDAIQKRLYDIPQKIHSKLSRY